MKSKVYLILKNDNGLMYVMDESRAEIKQKRGEKFEVMSKHDKKEEAEKALRKSLENPASQKAAETK